MAGSQKSQFTPSSCECGKDFFQAIRFGAVTILRSVFELHLGAHLIAIFLIIIGSSLIIIAVNVTNGIPNAVEPAGPLMVAAGVVIILLSWSSALIEQSGKRAAEMTLLRVRLFTRATSQPARDADASDGVSNGPFRTSDANALASADIELPSRYSFDAEELPIFITKPARARGDSAQGRTGRAGTGRDPSGHGGEESRGGKEKEKRTIGIGVEDSPTEGDKRQLIEKF